MNTSEEIKALVREKYGEIASQSKEQNETSCCGSCGCGTEHNSIMSENYSALEGYAPEADLGLGCGIPTEHAHMKAGDTVLDLGSGAGNDCFVARSVVGEGGKVIGVDMTPAMIEKARANAEKLGYNNVEFRLGEIEHLPVPANKVDVVVSNCVLNLVPDKLIAFKEMFRVMKPGGHFSISDIVLKGILPDAIRSAGEMYAGCVAGAMQMEEYLRLIDTAGFKNITVQKERLIELPDEILLQYLSKSELAAFRQSSTGIYSITVYGEKPKTEACCGDGCCS